MTPRLLFPRLQEFPRETSTLDGLTYRTRYFCNLYSVINLCGFDYPELMDELERLTPMLYRTRLTIQHQAQMPPARCGKRSGIWAGLRAALFPDSDNSCLPILQGPPCRLCQILVLHRKEQRRHLEPLLKDYRHLVPIECELPESLTVEEARQAASTICLTMK